MNLGLWTEIENYKAQHKDANIINTILINTMEV